MTGRLLPMIVLSFLVDSPHGPPATADQPNDESLAVQLARLDAGVFSPDEAKERRLAEMLQRDVRRRLQQANQRETDAWRSLHDVADWERYRDARVATLRESLGQFPPVPDDLHVRVTRRIEGRGYRIDNLVFESRPGVFVTANLYYPDRPPPSMPGILLCHSHHNPSPPA